MKLRITVALFIAVSFAIAVRAAKLDPAPDPSLEPGRALYAQKCQGCHRLRQPSKIDPRKWPSILEKMSVKAKLTAEEESQIDAYVRSVAPK